MKFAAKSALFLIAGVTLASAQRQYATPIEHVIIVVQENRSPDDMFQDAKLIANGADIRKASDAVAVPLGSCWDIGHNHTTWEQEYERQQKKENFCMTKIYPTLKCPPINCPQDTYVENTPKDKVIQPYWDIAETYGFANYFFQTNQGPSAPAHEILFSGTSAPVSYPIAGSFEYNPFPLYRLFDAESGHYHQANVTNFGCAATLSSQADDIDPTSKEGFYYKPVEHENVPVGYPCYETWTLADQLDNAGLSWRYYGYMQARALFNAPNAIRHICDGKPGGKCRGIHWANGDVDLHDWDIFSDLGANSPTTCKLSAVSWVIPNGGYSDHPKYNGNQGGPDWVANIVDAVGKSTCKNHDGSSYWDSTAIFILWDDWGGFYDHVPPYEVLKTEGTGNKDNCQQFGCGYVAGFRVPLLVVSAYTGTYNNGKWSGYISGTSGQGGEVPPYIHDFGSILNFVQYVFSAQGTVQGEISQTSPDWAYDDFWAPDFYLNGVEKCPAQTCPFGLSDFFGNPSSGYFKNPRPFQKIKPQRFQPRNFFNLSAFGGPENNPPDDEESP